VEKKMRKNGKVYWRPVADCIKERDIADDAPYLDGHPDWESWLQEWRVELNAITPPEFVAWINAQFEKHGASKTIPPEELALESVSESIKAKLLSAADAEVRKKRKSDLAEIQDLLDALEAEIEEETDNLTAERLEAIELPTGAEVVKRIKAWLKTENHSHWRNSIGHVATTLIPKEQQPSEPADEEEGE
jgi:hypothetical protein